MPRHATSGSWKPGQSGNPGGRPKRLDTIARELLGKDADRETAAVLAFARLTGRFDVATALEWLASLGGEKVKSFRAAQFKTAQARDLTFDQWLQSVSLAGGNLPRADSPALQGSELDDIHERFAAIAAKSGTG